MAAVRRRGRVRSRAYPTNYEITRHARSAKLPSDGLCIGPPWTCPERIAPKEGQHCPDLRRHNSPPLASGPHQGARPVGSYGYVTRLRSASADRFVPPARGHGVGGVHGGTPGTSGRTSWARRNVCSWRDLHWEPHQSFSNLQASTGAPGHAARYPADLAFQPVACRLGLLLHVCAGEHGHRPPKVSSGPRVDGAWSIRSQHHRLSESYQGVRPRSLRNLDRDLCQSWFPWSPRTHRSRRTSS